MKTLKKLLKLLFWKVFLQKITAYVLLILAFYLLQDFLLIFFLTFVFAYLFLTFWEFLKYKFDHFIEKILRSKKEVHFFKKFVSLNIIIIFLYLSFIGIIFFAVSDMLPKLLSELKDLPKYVPMLKEPVSMVAEKLEEIKNINTEIGGSIYEVFSKQNIDIFMQVFDKLKKFWAIFLQILLSLILSYIFIADREKLGEYLKWVQSSNFAFLYNEYKTIIEKIVRTFGLVFKAQSMIALTNAVLTTIGLFIIWLTHYSSFPFLYTLGIIVFICWFIPVLGTFISSVPILIIGYATFHTWSIIVEIVLLISFIHAIEAYYLNPKIVSSFINLPVSLTFLVLILSEHFMWFAGLVIWISSFYLLLELLRDADKIITKSKMALSDMNDVENETKDNIKKWIRVSRKVDE